MKCALYLMSLMLLAISMLNADHTTDVKNMTMESFSKDGEFKEIYKELSPLIDISKQNIELTQEEHQRLENIVEEFNLIIEPLDLSDLNAVKIAAEKLHLIKQKVKDSQTRYNKIISTADKQLKSLAAKNKKKSWDAYLEGYNRSTEEGVALTNERYNVLIEITQVSRDSYSFLMSIPESYAYEDNQLFFENDEDIEKYNLYAKRLAELTNQEMSIMERMNAGPAEVSESA